VTEAEPENGRPAGGRLARAYPALLAYVLLLVLYAWQTTKHPTPWLFTDELEWAGQSRGVAHHGVPQLRLHDVPFSSLYAYLIAPAWWATWTGPGYAAAKYINVVVMAASLFPGVALARLFVPRGAALAAGIATAAIPSLAYTSILIPETLAYFWSTLTIWLIARALLRPARWHVVEALAAIAIGLAIRSELQMLAVAAALAALIMAATGARGRRLIGSWSRGQQLGAATLGVLAAIWVGAVLTHHSYSWEIGTYFHHRAFTYGLWAFGALTIGLGVLPVFVSLAWLFGNRFREPGDRALGATLVGTTVAFGIYTAVKASYLSTNFAIRVEERNLIYLSPVVFAVTARWAVHARTRLVAILIAGAAVGYLLATTPYHNNEHFYSDAPGLSVLQWMNQNWSVTTSQAENVLFGILIGGVVLAAAIEALGRRSALRRWALPAGCLLAVAVVGWNLWGEIAAANASNAMAKAFRSVLPTPPDWIDRSTDRARTMFIGQSLGGSNAFWSLEFWNQSISYVWSVDASAPGPGIVTTPNFVDTTGTIAPQLPFDYVVAGPGVDPVGVLVEPPVGGLRLYRVAKPVRLADAQGGITPDGWMQSGAWYYRFAPHGPRPGVASHITIRASRLRIDADGQPAAGRTLAVRHVTIRSDPCETKVVTIPVTTPFRLDVSAQGTFQPSQYDLRQLSAQVGFGFTPS
jgi:hypothetical protein